jgi:hypothetical protein
MRLSSIGALFTDRDYAGRVTALALLLDNPLLLMAVLAVGAFVGIGVERFVEGRKRSERQAYWRGRRQDGRAKGGLIPTSHGTVTATDFAARQLATVSAAPFKARAVLNKPERRLLALIDGALVKESPGWRAFAQVSLGEILYSPDKDAFLAVNSKRVDLLIVDGDCRPLHAIEFQGTGHHNGPTAAARDAVKKEALRRAGIGYIEVVTGDTPSQVRQQILRLVERAGQDSSAGSGAGAAAERGKAGQRLAAPDVALANRRLA